MHVKAAPLRLLRFLSLHLRKALSVHHPRPQAFQLQNGTI